MKPSFYTCGGGGNINCEYWDDVNGCWADQIDVCTCPIRIRQEKIDDEMDDGAGGY